MLTRLAVRRRDLLSKRKKRAGNFFFQTELVQSILAVHNTIQPRLGGWGRPQRQMSDGRGHCIFRVARNQRTKVVSELG